VINGSGIARPPPAPDPPAPASPTGRLDEVEEKLGVLGSDGIVGRVVVAGALGLDGGAISVIGAGAGAGVGVGVIVTGVGVAWALTWGTDAVGCWPRWAHRPSQVPPPLPEPPRSELPGPLVLPDGGRCASPGPDPGKPLLPSPFPTPLPGPGTLCGRDGGETGRCETAGGAGGAGMLTGGTLP
jgi:hypothetical protein